MPLLTLATATAAGAGLGIAVGLFAGNRRKDLPPRRLRSWSDSINVVQYNVLADGKYAAVGKHSKSTHGGYNDHSKPSEREWRNRFPKLMQEMDAMAGDIYALEEIQYSRYQDSFRTAFGRRGFTTILSYDPSKDRGKPKRTSEEDLHVMIAVRDTTLKVVDTKVIDFAAETVKYQQHLPLELAQDEWFATVREKDNSALVALIEHHETKRRIVVVATHLYWHPAHPDIKALQACMLTQGLGKALASWGLPSNQSAPLILCGDLNSQPRNSLVHGGAEGVYELLTQGTLPQSHPDHPATPKPRILREEARPAACPGLPDLTTHGLILQSAFKAKTGHEMAYTTKTTQFTGTLDFIFTAGSSIEVLDVLSLPRPSDTPSGMPTATWPSDVSSRFVF